MDFGCDRNFHVLTYRFRDGFGQAFCVESAMALSAIFLTSVMDSNKDQTRNQTRKLLPRSLPGQATTARSRRTIARKVRSYCEQIAARFHPQKIRFTPSSAH